MKFTSFVGIDISKKVFDLVLLDQGGKKEGHKQFTNNAKGMEQMESWLQKQVALSSVLFCMEHCGIYSLPLCVYLENSHLKYSLQPGLQIKRSMGIQRGKNDKADALSIARYAYLYRADIRCSQLPSEAILRLKELLSYRERLVKARVSIQTASKELSQVWSEHSPICDRKLS